MITAYSHKLSFYVRFKSWHPSSLTT
jgi:hypothetical protein